MFSAEQGRLPFLCFSLFKLRARLVGVDGGC